MFFFIITEVCSVTWNVFDLFEFYIEKILVYFLAIIYDRFTWLSVSFLPNILWTINDKTYQELSVSLVKLCSDGLNYYYATYLYNLTF